MRALIRILLISVITAGLLPTALCGREKPDSVEFSRMPWVKQLVANGFHINDPQVNYPKFARWCVKVYNWGDRTFNTYDSTYVVASGKNWKAYMKSYNWGENYAMYFTDRTRLRMLSDVYCDMGASLCFMAVSLGYTWKLSDMAHQTHSGRQDFNFNFCCSLFSASFDYTYTQGGTKIIRFGDYRNPATGSHMLSRRFDDISLKSLGADVYYFFNHRRYSQAAAYCYSKYQLKSAGSWIAGVSITSQRIGMDFDSLPEDMLEALPTLKRKYAFHYADYDVLGGYAHNWVLKPRRWLLNLTVLPSVGYRHSYEDATDGKKDMFSTNIRGMFAVVYNNRSLFASLNLRFDGHVFYTNDYTFFNSIQSGSLLVGVRF